MYSTNHMSVEGIKDDNVLLREAIMLHSSPDVGPVYRIECGFEVNKVNARGKLISKAHSMITCSESNWSMQDLFF